MPTTRQTTWPETARHALDALRYAVEGGAHCDVFGAKGAQLAFGALVEAGRQADAAAQSATYQAMLVDSTAVLEQASLVLEPADLVGRRSYENLLDAQRPSPNP